MNFSFPFFFSPKQQTKKKGTPRERKVALRTITDRANDFGPAPLFNQILPLLMSPSLEDQERHLLVKVIDRILFKLQERVRPFVHRILMVIVPMLIDEGKFIHFFYPFFYPFYFYFIFGYHEILIHSNLNFS